MCGGGMNHHHERDWSYVRIFLKKKTEQKQNPCVRFFSAAHFIEEVAKEFVLPLPSVLNGIT